MILAGGKGSRLGPYTTVLPKPLLPVGERAILDVVVHQLRDCGFGEITLAVGYLAHLVRAVMGDGSRHGVHINYSEETEPLGTVGPLAEIDDLDDTFLVMNGDVLTALDYGAPDGRPPRVAATCSRSPRTDASCAPSTACSTSPTRTATC